MGWRTIVINEHCKLTYRSNHLYFKSARNVEMIHLSEIDILLLETTDISLTTMLLKRLIDENILIIFCDDKRLPIGRVLPFYGRHDSSLQLGRQVNWNEKLKQHVWTEIILQKLVNQAQHLLVLEFVEKADAIKRLYEELQPFDPTNREGHAARIYFNTLFGQSFTRESDNDINAGLNYGYSLLMSVFSREIVRNGCMTQFGLKHHNQFNDFNLASDLMEPFRPIVDQIIFENRQSDFVCMKRQLLNIFSEVYQYNDKNMFLSNIAEDYTRQMMKVLNGKTERMPVFRV